MCCVQTRWRWRCWGRVRRLNEALRTASVSPWRFVFPCLLPSYNFSKIIIFERLIHVNMHINTGEGETQSFNVTPVPLPLIMTRTSDNHRCCKLFKYAVLHMAILSWGEPRCRPPVTFPKETAQFAPCCQI